MPLLPDDEARLRQRYAALLPESLNLSSFPPGWMGCLEKFLKNVEDYRKWAKHHVSIRQLQVKGLVVIVLFYGIPTNNKHLNFIRQLLKRHCLHSCKICSQRARTINPIVGLALCDACFELVRVPD